MNSNNIHHGNQFKKILIHAPWYFLSDVLMKLSGLILMPVYTTYLSPEDYGILNTLYAFSNLLPLFISLSLESSFSRYYFHEKTISARNVKELYSHAFLVYPALGRYRHFSLARCCSISLPVFSRKIPYSAIYPARRDSHVLVTIDSFRRDVSAKYVENEAVYCHEFCQICSCHIDHSHFADFL